MKTFFQVATLSLIVITTMSCNNQISKAEYNRLSYEYKQLEKRYDLLQAKSGVTITNNTSEEFVEKVQFDELQNRYNSALKEKRALEAQINDAASDSEDLSKKERKRLAMLESENTQLKESLAKAESMTNTATSDDMIAKSEFNKVMEDLRAAQMENAGVKKMLEAKNAEIKQLSALNNSSSDDEKTKMLAAKNEELTKEIGDLQKQLKKAERKGGKSKGGDGVSKEDYEAVFAQVNTLTAQLEDAKQNTGGVSIREQNIMKQKIEQLETENKRLKEVTPAGNTVAKSDYDELSREYDALLKKYNNAQSDNSSMLSPEELIKLQYNFNEVKRNYQELQKDYKALEDRYNHLKATSSN